MLGIRYLKVPPTTYVILYRGGEAVRQGAGLSFFYYSPTSTVVQIPLSTIDVPFLFEETTVDFQDVTIQGELTYRIVDPTVISAMLDYTVNANGRHLSDDPTKLNDRLIQVAKTVSRGFVQRQSLAAVLTSSDELVTHITSHVAESETVKMHGLEVLGIALQSIKPTPEMAKALQAGAREKLLQQADEAVYARRNVSIELEREIKENELRTQIAVENKQREVRTTKLEADIALEQQRSELVDTQVANETKESEARAAALKATLDAVKDVDWRTLLATQEGGLDSKQMIAMAFRDLADNAEKIGSLNISPDLLSNLLDSANRDQQERD
ncbi:MAG: SPFH domain-containing protein [Planctomycetota bacterium]